MNRLTNLLASKKKNILNVYCTAGFPSLDSTVEVIDALEKSGVDIVEVGIPYSDPIADGPVIQQSNMKAIANGISLPKIFDQLTGIRNSNHIPIILMGYLNPVLQYGFEKFCKDAKRVGADAIILPDLPMYEFENEYGKYIKENDLHFIFLITPETTDERIRNIDRLSTAFIYAVSSSATTGNEVNTNNLNSYLKRIEAMELQHPVLVGFGIKDRASFLGATANTSGAIIGSAFIKMLEQNVNIKKGIPDYIHSILND